MFIVTLKVARIFVKNNTKRAVNLYYIALAQYKPFLPYRFAVNIKDLMNIPKECI